MTIGELAVCAGVTIDAIRFHERRGLLPRARRTASGYRTHSGAESERRKLIEFPQRFGAPQSERDERQAKDDGRMAHVEPAT